MDVTFPEMGDSVAEGTVLEWRVKVGDPVAVDDPLVEISTDKVDAEMPSPVAGTIAEILVEADQTVPVGTVLCRIAAGSRRLDGPVQPKAEATAAKPAAGSVRAGNGGNATPVAARMASAHGLDVNGIRHRPARPRDQGGRARRGRGQRRAAAAASRRRGRADPRARRHARALHGREPLDPDRHQLPHAAGGRARRAPQARSRRPARSCRSRT